MQVVIKPYNLGEGLTTTLAATTTNEEVVVKDEGPTNTIFKEIE